MPQATTTQPTPLELAAALTEQVLLARATDLARAGDYASADTLLDELASSGKESAPAVDLAARMAAQQGKLAQAKALWQRALELAPGEDAYRAGLQRVLAVQRQPLLGKLLVLHPWRVVILAAVLLMACLSIVQTWRTLHLQAQLIDTSATAAVQAAILAKPTSTLEPPPTAVPTAQPTAAPTLQPTSAPTAEPLAERAQAQLEAAQAEVGVNIQAAERAGVIYLSGQVPNAAARDIAAAQVQGIPGVISVEISALVVVPLELASEVERALANQDGGLRFQLQGVGVRLIGTVIGEAGLRAALTALRQVPGVAWVDSSQVLIESLYRPYTVQPDDTLASIALAELGDADAWPTIFDLNRDLIAEPGLIRPGMVLKLPRK